jgi:hypothetical protein
MDKRKSFPLNRESPSPENLNHKYSHTRRIAINEWQKAVSSGDTKIKRESIWLVGVDTKFGYGTYRGIHALFH